tara:strand:- start:40796 stop:41380 length:585 start_codon:yes stop_codon:yes gene_type:complete
LQAFASTFFRILNLPKRKTKTMNKLTNGFILTGAYIIIGLVLYILGPDVVTNQWVGLVKGLLLLGVLIYLSMNIRKASPNGFITYKNLFGALFITVAVYSVAALLFDVVLFKFIDPDFMIAVKEKSIENMMDAPWAKNLSDTQMDNIISETEKGFDQAFKAKGLAIAFAMKIIPWTIISLILAAIFKRKQPDFA